MSALSGVDIALWDLKGKFDVQRIEEILLIVTARKLGVPIYQLLGGPVRNKVKVYAWIGGDRPSDVAKQA
jgi:galactonate dehydratase